jgi:hypothetical protein
MSQFIQLISAWIQGNTLPQRERSVRRKLKPFLAEYANLVAFIYDFVVHAAKVYAANEKVQQAVANLQLLLLTRLQADLRVCQRAACDGYPLQALTVASSIHEVSYGLIYLGRLNERAREWVEHTITRKQYPESGHRSAIESAATYFPLTQAQIEQEYGIYTQLCWGKHGNPILQREYGVIDKGLVVEIQQQPYFADRTVKYGRYALLHSSRAVGAALVVFTQLHLETVADARLVNELGAIGPELNRLGTRDGLMLSTL